MQRNRSTDCRSAPDSHALEAGEFVGDLAGEIEKAQIHGTCDRREQLGRGVFTATFDLGEVLTRHPRALCGLDESLAALVAVSAQHATCDLTPERFRRVGRVRIVRRCHAFERRSPIPSAVGPSAVSRQAPQLRARSARTRALVSQSMHLSVTDLPYTSGWGSGDSVSSDWAPASRKLSSITPLMSGG